MPCGCRGGSRPKIPIAPRTNVGPIKQVSPPVRPLRAVKPKQMNITPPSQHTRVRIEKIRQQAIKKSLNK